MAHRILGFVRTLVIMSCCTLLAACAENGTNSVTLLPSDYSMDANARERYLVYFAFDSYALDDTATLQVEALYEEIIRGGANTVLVNGHTDTMGSDRYNMMLSNQRAEAVRDMLVAMGLDQEKVQTYGFGETDPAVPTPDETYEPQNRRVEAVIY